MRKIAIVGGGLLVDHKLLWTTSNEYPSGSNTSAA
jgi:hypothetical protein